MSEEQLKAFLEKVKADTSLQEKLKAAADSEEVAAIAKDAGFMVTTDDLIKAQSELSEQDLEGVAGGNSINNTCNTLWCGCPRNTRNDPGCNVTRGNPQGC
tara:strand:- start:338 stop:640 length:303 start_codon:yes stop_codon:yes gene_type:complete